MLTGSQMQIRGNRTESAELQVYDDTRYIDEAEADHGGRAKGLKIKDLGRPPDMLKLPIACCAGTARQEQVYASQGEQWRCEQVIRGQNLVPGVDWRPTGKSVPQGYSPYGELEAGVAAHPFDYDGDGAVDCAKLN
ncbi:MAG TPA: hypothetical protein P5572_03750 [Phycisphaerae bacterium]|nr:hypothetical protein [Phycisphaerales bacterium]HRX84111.1 hypothetical protein [Phycisphaerae bacterium]